MFGETDLVGIFFTSSIFLAAGLARTSFFGVLGFSSSFTGVGSLDLVIAGISVVFFVPAFFEI